MRRNVVIVDRFFQGAEPLRAHFEERFADPREARSDRFVWDYWHVPGQYTALRTPAYHYFPKAQYDAFHQHLVWWGRRTLGCHDVSPPWLSCYIEGCEQQLHGDLPHGHWAFVYSLTRWQSRRFEGGETLLLKDEVLDWWSGFESTRSIEERDVLREVPAKFNRLVVFDPRIPHGVRRVEGVKDPRFGRLVVHGWFVQPRPFVQGPLSTKELQQHIDGEVLEALRPWIEQRGLPVAGLLSLGFDVKLDGTVSDTRILCDTTRVAREHERERAALIRDVTKAVSRIGFSKQRRPSKVTLPLVFER